MGSLSTVILPDVLRNIDVSTFTGNYQVVGTPLVYTTRIIKFSNFSNVLVTISWDGINDHEAIPPFSFLLLDVSTNKEASRTFEIQSGTQFYAKGDSGVGNLYISTYYARIT